MSSPHDTHDSFCWSAVLHMPLRGFCLRNRALRHCLFHPLSTIAKPPGVLGVRGHFRRYFTNSLSVTDQSAWHRNATRFVFCELTGLHWESVLLLFPHSAFLNQKYIICFICTYFLNKLKHKTPQKVLPACCYSIQYYVPYYQAACVALSDGEKSRWNSVATWMIYSCVFILYIIFSVSSTDLSRQTNASNS